MKKTVTVFFDLEACLDAPSKRRFDLRENMQKISKILDKHKVRAAFNTCGIVVERFPGMIKELHNQGHEIASHGYAHENFVQLEQIGELGAVLRKTEKLVEDITDEKLFGVRSPWLMHNNRVYSILKKRGYKWVSNRSIFRTEILKAPGVTFPLVKCLFFSMLWKTYKKEPFKIGGLLEIPLLSSQDGELLGLVYPGQRTPKSRLDFAYQSLKTQFDKSGKIFNLNFHPWLIGSANRPVLLDRILGYITSHEVEFVLPKDILKK